MEFAKVCLALFACGILFTLGFVALELVRAYKEKKANKARRVL
jgi:hypothetical protein